MEVSTCTAGHMILPLELESGIPPGPGAFQGLVCPSANGHLLYAGLCACPCAGVHRACSGHRMNKHRIEVIEVAVRATRHFIPSSPDLGLNRDHQPTGQGLPGCHFAKTRAYLGSRPRVWPCGFKTHLCGSLSYNFTGQAVHYWGTSRKTSLSRHSWERVCLWTDFSGDGALS